MKALTRSGWTRVLTNITYLVVFFQGILPSFNLSDSTATIWTVIFMTVASVATIWKQRLSVEIRDGAIWATIIVSLVAVAGGLNELVDYIYLDDVQRKVARAVIVAAIGGLNLLSKSLFPTYEAKVIESVKTTVGTNG